MQICGQKNSVEKKAVNLRQQAVTTKCRGYINAEPKSRVFEKAVSIRAKKHSPVPIIFNLHTEKVQLIINTYCS